MTCYRSSKMDLLTQCPAAQQEPAVKMLHDDSDAALGSAVHGVLFGLPDKPGWIETDPADEMIALCAASFCVPEPEITPLAWQAWKRWLAVRDYFPDPTCEVEMVSVLPDGSTLTGHADVLSLTKGPRILDLKTGFLDSDHDEQLRAYAWLALQEHRDADQCYTMVLRVREGTTDGRAYERGELDAWAKRLVQRLAQKDAYHPGRWCGYCPRAHECPARTALMQQVRGDLADVIDGELTPQDRPGAFWQNALVGAKMLEQLAGQIRDQARAAVVAAGGVLPAEPGWELQLNEVVQRKIAFDRGWELLSKRGLCTPEVRAAMTIPRDEVEAAVKATAGRGMKGRAVSELLDALDDAGAIRRIAVPRLEVRRAAALTEVSHGDSPTGSEPAAIGTGTDARVD